MKCWKYDRQYTNIRITVYPGTAKNGGLQNFYPININSGDTILS
jgi:hypothetical protein